MPPSYLPPQAGEGDTRLRGNDDLAECTEFFNNLLDRAFCVVFLILLILLILSIKRT